ncbi:MAG: N-acetylmuramoyl-L-alanine amidase [Oscillospiraceae bacterium]|nr:N-acetylmuramoyl-L-alanine amidase [Oscillospiraceae bacterium]
MGGIILRIKNALTGAADFVMNENTTRFKVEMILIFILTGVIFMTAVYMGYTPGEKTSAVFENFDMPEVKPYRLMQIGYNVTPLERSAGDINYIVIHDTGNTRESADAVNHYNFFNSGNQKASADFFTDSNGIIQVNDYYKYYTWHCGDGGEDAKIKNKNSISIEICINRDGDYDTAVNNAVILTRILMKELDIDINHVVRHHDASGKDCPVTMNNKDWKYFKDSVMNKKSPDGYIMSYSQK